MRCPNCNESMIPGYLYGDRYALKWLPFTKKLVAGTFVKGGIQLKRNGIFNRPKTKSYCCSRCNKLIIDLNTEQHK